MRRAALLLLFYTTTCRYGLSEIHPLFLPFCGVVIAPANNKSGITKGYYYARAWVPEALRATGRISLLLWLNQEKNPLFDLCACVVSRIIPGQAIIEAR